MGEDSFEQKLDEYLEAMLEDLDSDRRLEDDFNRGKKLALYEVRAYVLLNRKGV